MYVQELCVQELMREEEVCVQELCVQELMREEKVCVQELCVQELIREKEVCVLSTDEVQGVQPGVDEGGGGVRPFN